MNNINIITSLTEFYSKCLKSGMVKIKDHCNQGLTLILSPNIGGSPKDGIRHIDSLLMNVKKVCWITPNLSRKNLNKLNDIVTNYADYYYVSAEPMFNGTWYRIKAYTDYGRKLKTWYIRLFSINLF